MELLEKQLQVQTFPWQCLDFMSISKTTTTRQVSKLTPSLLMIISLAYIPTQLPISTTIR